MYLLPPHFMTVLWLTMSGAEGETRLSHPAPTCKEFVTTDEWKHFSVSYENTHDFKNIPLLLLDWTGTFRKSCRNGARERGREPERHLQGQPPPSGALPPHSSWRYSLQHPYKCCNSGASFFEELLSFLPSFKVDYYHFTLVYYLLLTTTTRNSIWEPWDLFQWKTNQN